MCSFIHSKSNLAWSIPPSLTAFPRRQRWIAPSRTTGRTGLAPSRRCLPRRRGRHLRSAARQPARRDGRGPAFLEDRSGFGRKQARRKGAPKGPLRRVSVLLHGSDPSSPGVSERDPERSAGADWGGIRRCAKSPASVARFPAQRHVPDWVGVPARTYQRQTKAHRTRLFMRRLSGTRQVRTDERLADRVGQRSAML